MEVSALSIMFAKAYGIYFTVVGLALLIDPSRFRAWYEDILAEGRRVVFGGTVALLIGSFILASHHLLVADWRLIITLIGYWGVLAGAGSLISGTFIKNFEWMINSGDIVYRASGVVWAVLGVYLAVQGFGL